MKSFSDNMFITIIVTMKNKKKEKNIPLTWKQFTFYCIVLATPCSLQILVP